MTKKAINYTKMYEIKKENGDFPSKLNQLMILIIKDQRRKKNEKYL